MFRKNGLFCSFLASACLLGKPALLFSQSWPQEVRQVNIPCSDGKNQPAMWFSPSSSGKKPLLVGLHTWSGNFFQAQGSSIYAAWCIQQGWAFLHPNFRGPNKTPEAMGSDRAVKDIVEAVEWARGQAEIDPDRIYVVGASGGAYLALLLAGRHPELWAGISAWCPITDIQQWHEDHSPQGKPDNYARDIEACLGGSPDSGSAKKEAHDRSPVKWLGQATQVPLDINAGIDDGRKGSVPFSHSLLAFNAVVADPSARLDEKEIAAYYASRQLPSGWAAAEADPAYGSWTPLFRKTQGNVRVTIFSGKHEIVYQAALNWLAQQQKGKPAAWTLANVVELSVRGGESSK
jgi:pimeloyl-ACP methyl ester carboxylesterase